MSLATKIFAAFCLVFLAGLAQAFLALPGVEGAFVSAYLARPDTTSPHDLSLLPIIAGALGLMLIPVALALRARRVIVAPLRSMSATLDRIGREGFDLPPPMERADEIGNLDRAIRHVATQLATPDEPWRDPDLSEELDRYQDFAALAADWLWETDAEGRISFVSGKLPGMQDQEPGRFIGCPLSAWMSVPVDGGATRVLELESRRPLRDLICRYDGVDGPRFCRLSGHAVTGTDDTFAGYRGTATDITDEVQTREAEKNLAFHDPLTGLANRRLLEVRIEQALTARALTKGDVAVICLDLDRFKALNDSLGHEAGDLVLRQVGTRLKALVGPSDTVGRLADDAFAVIQASGSQPEAAEHLCRSILSSLRAPFVIGDRSCQLTASVGCAIASPEETSAVTLLRDADNAMYRAIDDGRDTYRLHDTETTTRQRTRATMDRDLRQAIETGELDVRYQPIITAATGEICGFETMIRWPRPGHGMVYPGEFLPHAEETGLIVPLETSILTTACQAATTWPSMSVAVNISPLHFLHDGFLKTVDRALRESGLSAALLELELSETALLGAEDTLLFRIDAIRELGVRLVLDKFGSGPSSLRHLRRLHFDKVKLDRGVISAIAHDQGAAAIMRSVLDLAHALDMQTAAEGVTSEKQAALLTAQGCGQLQGKYFAKALTMESAATLIGNPGTPRTETSL